MEDASRRRRSSSVYSQDMKRDITAPISSSTSVPNTPIEVYEILAPRTYVPPPAQQGTAIFFAPNSRPTSDSIRHLPATSADEARSISLNEAYWKIRRSSNILLPEEMRANVVRLRTSKASPNAKDATHSRPSSSMHRFKHPASLTKSHSSSHSNKPFQVLDSCPTEREIQSDNPRRAEHHTQDQLSVSPATEVSERSQSRPQSRSEYLAQMYHDLLRDCTSQYEDHTGTNPVASPSKSDMLPRPLFYSRQVSRSYSEEFLTSSEHVVLDPERSDVDPRSLPHVEKTQANQRATELFVDTMPYTGEWFDSSPSRPQDGCTTPATPHHEESFSKSPTSTYTTDPEEPTTPILGLFASPPLTEVPLTGKGPELRGSNSTTFSAIREMFSGSSGELKESGAADEMKGKWSKLADKASASAIFDIAERRRERARERKRQELKRTIRLVRTYEI